MLWAGRGHDFQQFNGGLLIAVNNRQAPVRWDGLVEPKPFHHRRIGNHAQEAARLDPAKDIMLNEDATQRRLTGDNLFTHLLITITKVDFHNAELNDSTGAVQRQQDLASVDVTCMPAGENADSD